MFYFLAACTFLGAGASRFLIEQNFEKKVRSGESNCLGYHGAVEVIQYLTGPDESLSEGGAPDPTFREVINGDQSETVVAANKVEVDRLHVCC